MGVIQQLREKRSTTAGSVGKSFEARIADYKEDLADCLYPVFDHFVGQGKKARPLTKFIRLFDFQKQSQSRT